jgi:putative ABC transport system permease protein
MAQGLTALANSVLPLSWSVRAAQNPTSLRMAIEQEFRAVDGQMTVARVRPMEQVIADSIARQNFTMLLLSIFAGIALLLAAIGIYGLMSYSVEQRTQEIGIRVALGAGRPAMLRLVLAQGLKLAGSGVVIGIAIALGMTRVLATLLFGIKATDPFTYAGVAAILLAVALSATYLPARRAATVDPIEALRYQ